LLWKSAKESNSCKEGRKQWIQTFFKYPIKVEKSDCGRLKLTLGIHKPDPRNPDQVIRSGTEEENICDIIFRSVGYKGRRVFLELPFDDAKGIIPNIGGRVEKGEILCISTMSIMYVFIVNPYINANHLE